MGTDDEAREAILARRARFIAAALATAGIATAACGGRSEDNEPAQSRGAGGSGGVTSGSGGVTSGAGGISIGAGGTGGLVVEAVDAGSFDAAPLPCLSIVR